MTTVEKTELDGRGLHAEDGNAVDITTEDLSPEEDKRLLRKIDRWYGSATQLLLRVLDGTLRQW